MLPKHREDKKKILWIQNFLPLTNRLQYNNINKINKNVNNNISYINVSFILHDSLKGNWSLFQVIEPSSINWNWQVTLVVFLEHLHQILHLVDHPWRFMIESALHSLTHSWKPVWWNKYNTHDQCNITIYLAYCITEIQEYIRRNMEQDLPCNNPARLYYASCSSDI